MDIVRAAIYARCSTEEESQRDALKAQAEEARECVRSHGWTLAEEYIESRSGTSTKGRTEYNRLYEDLAKNKFDILVIKSQDRLMRNTKDWYLFVDRLTLWKKRLYIYIEQKFYTPDDNLLTGIKAILAEDYSRELSKKINNAHYNRQKRGSTVLLTNHTYGFRKLPDKSIKIEESEAAVKHHMYELCAAGYGSRKIAAILREEGVVNRKGNPFSDSDIRRMIRNPINKGTVVMRRTHFDFDTKKTVAIPKEEQFVYEDRIPAIVTKELWQKANEQISKRSSSKNKGEFDGEQRQQSRYGKYQGKSCISGKLLCGLCKTPYYRTSRTSKRLQKSVYYWNCSRYLQQGGCCKNIHIREEELYHFLWDHVAGIQEDWMGKLADREEELLKRMWKEEAAQTEWNTETKRKELEKKMHILLEKLLEGTISDAIYKKKQKEIEERLAQITREKLNIEKASKEEAGSAERLMEIHGFLRKTALQKAVVQCLLKKVERMELYPNELWIIKREKKVLLPLENNLNYRGKKRQERETLVKMLEENPYLTAKEMSKKMDVSLSCIQYRIRILIKEGRIQFIGAGGKGYWKIKMPAAD